MKAMLFALRLNELLDAASIMITRLEKINPFFTHKIYNSMLLR